MTNISKQYNAIFYNPNTTDPKKWRDINDSTLKKERLARVLFISAGILLIIGSVLGAYFGGFIQAKLMKVCYVMIGGGGGLGLFFIFSGLMRNDARENRWPDPKIPSYKTTKSFYRDVARDNIEYSEVSDKIFKGGRGLPELVCNSILTIDQAKIIASVQDQYENALALKSNEVIVCFNNSIWNNALIALRPHPQDEGEKLN